MNLEFFAHNHYFVSHGDHVPHRRLIPLRLSLNSFVPADITWFYVRKRIFHLECVDRWCFDGRNGHGPKFRRNVCVRLSKVKMQKRQVKPVQLHESMMFSCFDSFTRSIRQIDSHFAAGTRVVCVCVFVLARTFMQNRFANSNNETLSEWLIIIISPIPCDKRTIEQYNNFWRRRRQQQRRCRLVFDSGGPPCFRHKITFVFVAFGHWFGTNTAKTKHFSIKICARVHPGCCAWVCLCLCHFATVTFGVALLLAPEYEQLNNRKTGRTTIQYAYYICMSNDSVAVAEGGWAAHEKKKIVYTKR